VTLLEIAALVGIGVVAGVLAGLLGIGGGLLMVPALVLVLGFDQHLAQGTSLLVVIPAAASGAWTHHRRGRWRLRDAAWIAVGGVLGAVLGSATALSIDEDQLQRLFALFLLAIAARMALGRPAAPPPPGV
jgi:uncharacterized membrane protein YfcA